MTRVLYLKYELQWNHKSFSKINDNVLFNDNQLKDNFVVLSLINRGESTYFSNKNTSIFIFINLFENKVKGKVGGEKRTRPSTKID